MRKLLLLLSILSINAFAQNTGGRFQLSPSESKVTWKGENFGGAGSHEGTIQLNSGYLLISADAVKGDFELDMNSIRNTDQRDEQGRKDLEEHLKSEDFFDVTKFPKAFFSITKIDPIPLKATNKADKYTVTGFLGIKGITNPITFVVVITVTNNVAHVQANLTFDRTKWNVTYQSKTIFNNLKEGALSDDVKISLDLILKEK